MTQALFMKKFRKVILKKLKKLPRSALLAGVLSVVLVISAVAAITFRSGDKPDSGLQANEKVEEIDTADVAKATLVLREGVVEYKTDDNWQTAPQDLAITPGMVIKTTGAAGRGIIRFEDNSELRIDSNTEIRFESLTTSRITVHQNSGNLYNRVVQSDTRTYSVQTENAQFQSVGTAYRTIASGDEESVEVYESSVRETTSNKTAKQGEKLIVKNFANPDVDGTIKPLDIGAVKGNQFIVWNRELDRANPTFKSTLGFLADFDGPTITINSPQSGSAVDVESTASNGTVTISGTTEKGAKLTVQSKSLGGSSAIPVTVGDDGSFTTEALQAPLGSSVFEFIATDRVGNKTSQNVTYQFNKKAAEQGQSITLSLDSSDSSQLKFNWTLEGITTPDGVQLVYGRSSSPEYKKGTTSKAITSGNSYTLKSADLDGYYFRICRYDKVSDTCDLYSNQIHKEL